MKKVIILAMAALMIVVCAGCAVSANAVSGTAQNTRDTIDVANCAESP